MPRPSPRPLPREGRLDKVLKLTLVEQIVAARREYKRLRVLGVDVQQDLVLADHVRQFVSRRAERKDQVILHQVVNDVLKAGRILEPAVTL